MSRKILVTKSSMSPCIEWSCVYYNVGIRVGTSLMEQIEGMLQVFGKDGRKFSIVFCPDKLNAPQYIMDIESVVKELGISPNTIRSLC